MPTSFPFPSNATNVPQLRTAAKNWAKQNGTIPVKDAESIISTLIRDQNSMKKCMAGILLGYLPAQRKALDPRLYDQWLDHTVGWAAVDAVCYANFKADEILEDFPAWEALLKNLVKSENPNKRRGALVLLTKPLTQSADSRLGRLAFHLIDNTKHEKDILLTKAISWLMRSLIKLHKKELETYLKANKDTLPAIALRETANKLRTGRKSGKE
jgi:3-methyladenine DNA glycosylase AlkD